MRLAARSATCAKASCAYVAYHAGLGSATASDATATAPHPPPRSAFFILLRTGVPAPPTRETSADELHRCNQVLELPLRRSSLS